VRIGVCLFLPILSLFSCGTTGGTVETAETAEKPKTLPPFTSPLYQETVYNGKPQPIEAAAASEDVPDMIAVYYPSEDARRIDDAGTLEAPVNAGVYYVKILRPGGNGYDRGEDVMAEYHINKAEVRIIADSRQSAAYNGDPKRVTASAEPPVPLSFSYYPAPEVRETAVRALLEPGGDTRSGFSAALRGLRRVERAPIEQGTYYAVVYFSGDENYNLAYKEIDFTIGPPARRK
jgi:hypothetical protein